MGFGAKPYTLTKADIDAVLGYDVDGHAGRHASGEADVVTPAAIAAVAKTGAETIAGVKSFDGVPMVKTTSGLYVPAYTSGRGGPHWDNSNWLPADMIQSGVSGSGEVTWADRYVRCATGATANSYAYVKKITYGSKSTDTWDKDRYFAANVAFEHNADACLKLVCGRIIDHRQPTNNGKHFGFQTEDDHLYASTGNDVGVQTKVDLGTFSVIENLRLEGKLFAGVRCEFYVDDVLVATITDTLPTGETNAAIVFEACAGNDAEGGDKRIWVYDYRMDQEE